MNNERQMELFVGLEAYHNKLGHQATSQQPTTQGPSVPKADKQLARLQPTQAKTKAKAKAKAQQQQVDADLSHHDITETRMTSKQQPSRDDVVLAAWEDDEQRPTEGQKNLVVLAERAKTSTLAWWMARYLYEATPGQSRHTKVAKIRDLETFWGFFVATNGHGEIREWRLRDTQIFIDKLVHKKRAPASINRIFATLRHFARWLQIHEDDPLKGLPLPTRTIKAIPIDEPDCKKLEANEMHALFKATDDLILLYAEDPKARPYRNKAMMAVLFYTGIRVSEMTAIAIDQLQNKHLVRVARKGRGRYKDIYLPKKCMEALHDYLLHERHLDPPHPKQPLFAAYSSGEPLNRQDVARAFIRIAQMASRHRPEKIHLHPHRLRHTFGAAYRERTGSDSETAQALGHAGMNYVGRYVRKTDAERQKDVDTMYDGF